MRLKTFPTLKISKLSKALIAVAAIFIIVSFVSPVISISTNPCSSYHGTKYYQQLDLLEANGQFPTNIQVGQTATVSIVLENLNNAVRNNLLTSVSVTLKSLNNHFSVNTPTYNIGSLSTGTAVATWQITGTSEGPDQLIISASAVNTHEPGLTFSDTYSSNPTLTVTGTAILPSPTPTPSLTQNPSATPTPLPSNPTVTLTPTPTTSLPSPKPLSSNDPTTIPSPTLEPSTNAPTTSNTPTTTPNTTDELNASPSPTLKSPQTGQENALNSGIIYVHPPLAIAGFIFIFIFAFVVLKTGISSRKTSKLIGLTAWVLSALGLLTGMILAQIVTGSYWSWDPKETLMLCLFSVFSISQVAFFENKQKMTKILLLVSCIMVILTGTSSFTFPT
jgi:hypothetical protein